ALRDRGGAGEIAEEDRHLLPFPLDDAAGGPDLVRQLLRQASPGEPRERIFRRRGRRVVQLGELQAAVGAEAEVRLERRAAAPTLRRDARSTGVAELLAGDQLGATRRAPHAIGVRRPT